MSSFTESYKRLNDEQRSAVDHIDGPLLVIAGPGTGKTELLATRTANILKQPGIGPDNVLCLTFTDNAARNMQQRLEQMIGLPAYHIGIHTFHSFGSDIINRYPDFFTERPLLQSIDELGRYEILRGLFEKLPYRNPLSVKVGEEFIYLRDTLDIISWLKHNALSPAEFQEICTGNTAFFVKANVLTQKAFSQPTAGKLLPEYEQLAADMGSLAKGQEERYGFPSYAALCTASLELAVGETDASARYAPAMTAWRNEWLEKNEDGQFIFKDSGRNLEKLQSTVSLYANFQQVMAEKGLYDFDDMVLDVVHALETKEELRLNLQERYLYILVDEFQDTNKAQLRILRALGDNSVNEGRPNIMVVGDPQQAIYAFQGAHTSNTISFISSFRDVVTVQLTDNYRSTQEILDASTVVIAADDAGNTQSGQPALVARGESAKGKLEHNVFSSELEQYQWLADTIRGYLDGGQRPDDIAIIAPKHRFLERLMPYLAEKHIPVAYERRENVLDAPIIVQLLSMVALTEAISKGDHDEADALFAQVLSYPFWDIATEALVSLSTECYDKHTHWLTTLLASKDSTLRELARWFADTAKTIGSEPLEYVLDRLSGSRSRTPDDESTDEPTALAPSKEKYISPFREYYFGRDRLIDADDRFLTYLGQLSTLRQHLRNWKPDQTLRTRDLLEFVRLHRQAGLQIVDTNPHTQSTNAVQVMTAYKAKGLEFGTVFAINLQDEVWGPSARSRTARIRLPQNVPVKPVGDSDADKLRLFFVALTRAKHTLHLSSYTRTLENKLSLGLRFIGGNGETSQPLHPAFQAHHMESSNAASAAEILATDWAYRYRQIIADQPTIFEPILSRYKLSVTHLGNFLDIVNAGPSHFLLHNLLRFPEAMSAPAAYGDAVHRTMQWLHVELRVNAKLPTIKAAQTYFADMLSRKHLQKAEEKSLLARGQDAIAYYLDQRADDFKPTDLVERGFNNEGVRIGEVLLSGKIDKLAKSADGQFRVIDFKTGRPAVSWQAKEEHDRQKLHRYRQQLYFYKLLVEGSASFGGKQTVVSGALDFVERNQQGRLVPPLELVYEQKELNRLQLLIRAVWAHIMTLNLPDTSGYSGDLKGIQAFEDDLIEGRV